MSTITNLKAKFEKYDKLKNEFANTHKPQVCKCCGCRIEPGDDIIIEPLTSDGIYCSSKCFIDSKGGVEVIYNHGDDAYESWFDRK